MNKAVIFLSAIFLIFFISFASAGINVSSANLTTTQYMPGGRITGIINLSLSGISSNAYISTNTGQNVSLANLLNAQSNFSFSCSTSDCSSAYSTQGSSQSTEKFSLNSGQSQTYGFVISGASPTVSTSSGQLFSLNVSSDAGMFGLPQLGIVLNDGVPQWTAYKASNTLGSGNYGCYSQASSQNQGNPTSILYSQPYCEEIFFPPTPEVNVGAIVSGSGNATFQMMIQDTNRTYSVGTCTTNVTNGAGSQQISCIPSNSNGNFSVKNSGNFYICISRTDLGTNYNVSIETASPCGFVSGSSSSISPGNFTTDFNIFGQTLLFAPVGNFVLNDSELTNSGYPSNKPNLEGGISNYLSKKYGKNCNNGCVIPLTFNSNESQNINISNFQMFYSSGGLLTQVSSLYNVTQTPALMNSNGYQNLVLDNANFSAPLTYGPYALTLTLVDGGTSYPLLSKQINISQIPIVTSVNPQIVPAAYPENFIAGINTLGSNVPITSYQWNFGDGSTIQTTSANNISHTYNQTGSFTLQITVSNSQGLNSTSNFTITAASPQNVANALLTQDFQGWINVQTVLGNYPAFTQNAVNQLLNPNNATYSLLENLQIKNGTASSDSDYINITNMLLQINIPQNISLSSDANSVPFIPSADSINLDALRRVGGGAYDDANKSDYTNSILYWESNNLSMTIDYSGFTAIYLNNASHLVDVVKLNIAGGSPLNNVYLFIPALGNIYFGSANYTLIGSYYYVPLTGNSQIIQFATTDSLSPVQLPIFVSPSLDQVPISAANIATTNNGNKIIIFAIIIGSIALVGIISYIIVGKWYQRKYESYLFKDRNDLYNIINYIHKSKIKGMKNIDIERNLRKSKWTAEQISYVMKKYAGRKVGIPGFKPK